MTPVCADSVHVLYTFSLKVRLLSLCGKLKKTIESAEALSVERMVGNAIYCLKMALIVLSISANVRAKLALLQRSFLRRNKYEMSVL